MRLHPASIRPSPTRLLVLSTVKTNAVHVGKGSRLRGHRAILRDGDLYGQVAARSRLSIQSEARLKSRANANASLSRSMISAESRPILRSRRTVGRDPNP